MKILVITDIHKDYDAARNAGVIEQPDLVLDCGDHDQILNLFADCPHFYIRGNHEPESIVYKKNVSNMPIYIPNGTIFEFGDEKNSVTFSGIDGNYGTRKHALQIDQHSIDYLKTMPSNYIDIMLLHESPFNVSKNARAYNIATQIISEIERLQPKIVISGHTNKFSEYNHKDKIIFINLPDMSSGYLVIIIDKNRQLKYERKTSYYTTKY